MKVKLLAIAVSMTLLGGCATVFEQFAPEEVDLKAVQSKKRDYPDHVRNGVEVAETNSWYLGTGESFKEGVAPPNKDVKVVGWNLPDDAILEYKPKSKTETKVVTVERFKKPEIAKSVLKIGENDKTLDKSEKSLAMTGKKVVEIKNANGKDTEQASLQPKNNELDSAATNVKQDEDTKSKPKYAYKQYPGDTDHIIIEASISLPEQHNLDFEFHADSLNLLDESRERLIHKAPLLLVYNKITVVGFYNKNTSPEEASKRAIKVRKELLRAGSNPNFVHISIEQGDGTGVNLRADEKNDVKIAYVEFIGQGDQFVTNKLDEFLGNFAPNATKWVRISAGADAYNSLSRALRVKDLLTDHGIDRESITILHRQEPIKTVKTLIYFREG